MAQADVIQLHCFGIIIKVATQSNGPVEASDAFLGDTEGLDEMKFGVFFLRFVAWTA